ncbi:sigma-70 family RNA polymerase sigma factor [Amycolatopsis cynarae]|uniref:Sigma-70 family RNA polymerase sigma factor n=1 Tax=Amycolatopsis cynarae TaxID=2995223 RepID=A0ABY7B381_9PSEU|nr:sigma-70 family RNA polymerase sigma factor [Amycolatopsis sp. HUAS 11-8]WAL66404.1 sigma-70 family RNA polymerase sigma factor [Amycolatopsis sp. HUAS 11-8]
MIDIRRTVDAVWKLESAAIIGGLTRLVHDVGLAEELAQDALVAALEQWPESGVPDNPGAWLMTTAKRRAIDRLRRSERLQRRHEQLAHELDQPQDGIEHDDVLRLMFLSCHPVLPTEQRVALTLRLVGGLTAAEIARAFLTTEQGISERIASAKKALAQAGVPFELPDGASLTERLSAVLDVVYLVFNEGYAATAGDDLIRPGLCQEALRLGRLLAELAPGEAEVHGLVALMELQASRSAARTGPSGEPVPLHEQNRGRWDPLLIRRGFTAMLRARDLGGPPGPYVLQAAIAVCHAQARTAEDTDWGQIATLYDMLVRVSPTPIVRLNRAVAVGMARGPEAGLALADDLTTDRTLRDYHLLPAVRGDLLARLGRNAEARIEFGRAAALTKNAAERDFLLRRAGEPETTAVVTLGQATADFLARGDLDTATLRSYGQTLRRLCLALGERRSLESLTAEDVTRVFEMSWGDAAPKTWNRHRSAIRSFTAWASSADLTAGLPRRAETRQRVPAIGAEQLDGLWNLDVPVRERTLWRMLYESAAGIRVVLSLDVENLDLEDRRAQVGHTWVNWRSGTARLLPELVAGRTRGPLFLTDRRPAPARTPADADLCPDTGRHRLSYERAEYLFKQATRTLDPAGRGYTLRQLRP